MIHLNTHEIAIALAMATNVDHMAFIAPPDADLRDFESLLPPEAIESAQTTGSAIIGFPSAAEATIVYSNIERQMSLLPGGEVVLVRGNGAISGSKRAATIVPVDFAREATASLKKAA